MSNQATFGVSIKDYAEERGKTIQAVYQQMKRKENAAALEGHVLTRRSGNRDVKYLDEEAVRILDTASHSTQTVIVQDDLKNELEETNRELELTRQRLVYQEGQMDALKELLDQKEAELRALAAPQIEIDTLKAQIADLKIDKDQLKGKIADADQKAVQANIEAFNAKVYAAEMKAYAKLPFFVRWFTKEPQLKEIENVTDEVE